MPHRFPVLAPPEKIRTRAVEKALPMPGLRWADAMMVGLAALILRMF